MDRIRWSERELSFRSLINDSNIRKPVLVRINNKAIVVGETISGEFLMASPCKVSGDRFDVLEEEIVLSSKHTGLWRVISKATAKKEDHIHRLTTGDLADIYKQDTRNERATPRSFICIRDIEAFELIAHSNDATVANGKRIERRIKQIEGNVEFEINDMSEVEYTPSEGERTSQDYIIVPKSKQSLFLQLLLPGVVEQEQVIRNRVLRALHCTTIGESRKRHFLLEVNELPCAVRPVASDGSTDLRYIHSTQNLYDYMVNHGDETILYVKLLRGDPPMKIIEFDGYMVLKSTLNGDKIPICRVDDLEITLVTPDIPVKTRLPARSDSSWRSSPEFRAAEVQCIQLSLALFARHESEMYVARQTKKNSKIYQESNYNGIVQANGSSESSDALKRHVEECKRVFGLSNGSTANKQNLSTTNDAKRAVSSRHTTSNILVSNGNMNRYDTTQPQVKTYVPNNIESGSPYSSRSKDGRAISTQRTSDKHQNEEDSYDHFHRTTIKESLIPFKSSNHTTNINKVKNYKIHQ